MDPVIKADAAIRRGLAGLTAIVGPLSWWVSPLNDLGITFITKTASADALEAVADFRFLVVTFLAAGLVDAD